MKILILIYSLSAFLLCNSRREKVIILTGGITCHACVNEIYKLITKSISYKRIYLGIENKGMFVNESAINYYKSDIPKVKIEIINSHKHFEQNKFPCVMKINNKDTLFFTYDEIYLNDKINNNTINKIISNK